VVSRYWPVQPPPAFRRDTRGLPAPRSYDAIHGWPVRSTAIEGYQPQSKLAVSAISRVHEAPSFAVYMRRWCVSS
jgi:hypothetical protein